MSAHGGDVGSLTLSNDGKRLFSGGSTITIWDLATGRELLALPDHAYGVANLALSADSKRLVSVGQDGTVKIWDLNAAR